MRITFATAEEVEDAFYEAIRRGDLEALMSIWADDEETVCIHPTGQRLTGSAAIRDSWRAIFANNPRFTVKIERKVCWKSVLLCVHNIVESLQLGNDLMPHGPMLSTNVFQCGVNGWRMLSRHTSAASTNGTPEPLSDPDVDPLRTLH